MGKKTKFKGELSDISFQVGERFHFILFCTELLKTFFVSGVALDENDLLRVFVLQCV